MTPEVIVQPTEYYVGVLPPDHIDADIWSCTVARRSEGKYAVLHLSKCLGRDGKWDREPITSERDGAWKASRRFPLEEALRLAKAAAPHIRIGGRTALEELALSRGPEEPAVNLTDHGLQLIDQPATPQSRRRSETALTDDETRYRNRLW